MTETERQRQKETETERETRQTERDRDTERDRQRESQRGTQECQNAGLRITRTDEPQGELETPGVARIRKGGRGVSPFPHPLLSHSAPALPSPLHLSQCLLVRAVRWLRFFNAQLSTKSSWRGPRSQEVGKDGDYNYRDPRRWGKMETIASTRLSPLTQPVTRKIRHSDRQRCKTF